ncbi:MAG: fimbrillin family protein [Parabacteroides sp.]|nr:fimbrillin family protein [Parabacteroides sp.]
MKTNHILLTALLLCAAAACTKENIDIPDTVDDNTLYPVTFSGGIDLVQTKTGEATSTMRKNVKARILVYANDANLSSATALASQEYTVGDEGKLTIGTSDTIYLAKGDYDIYAVAIDSLNITSPTFTNGEFLALNDSNYLWIKVDQNITGTAEAQNVALQFKRKAVMIAINIKAASGITIDDWDSTDPAMITPPDPGTTCKMKLSDGTITAATTVLTKTYAMKTGTVEGSDGSKTTSVSYIMLPLAEQNSSPVPTVTLKIKVKNTGESAATARKYETTLTYPTGGFASGKKYTYTATLKANGITFNAAKVEDWTDGTLGAGGGDLTPTEPEGTGSGS